jgi:trans-aconitate methyltransferase
MSDRISPRIANYVAALPLRPDMRVLEIGCGPGVAARAVSALLTTGTILAIDRSAAAIATATDGSADEIASGRLAFRRVAVEDFELQAGEQPFDLAFAMRVGALDGRHPELEARALSRLRAALSPDGILLIDDQKPLSGTDIGANSAISPVYQASLRARS